MLCINSSEDILRLSNTPSVKNCSICIGIISLGFGAACYGPESFYLKVGYVLGCFAIGASFLDDWEICVFDRNSQTVTLSRSNVYRKLLRYRSSDDVVVHLQSVMSVRVDPRSKTKDRVSLLLTNGMRLPVLDGSSGGDDDRAILSKTECNALADKLRRFLKLDHVEIVESDDLDEGNYYGSSESSSSDAEMEPIANNGRPRETITLINERR